MSPSLPLRLDPLTQGPLRRHHPLQDLVIRGAREHNLRDIDLELPRNSFIVFTGVSGSGKSTLAFDTIYAEGQRRYVESLSAYARQFLGIMDKPDVDAIEGLSPAISIDQKTTSHNPRSTVGTVTEIHDYLRLLFARAGIPTALSASDLSSANLPAKSWTSYWNDFSAARPCCLPQWCGGERASTASSSMTSVKKALLAYVSMERYGH